MRKPFEDQGLKGNVVAGTRVVLFGMDLDPGKLAGFRGFALTRRDEASGKVVSLCGMKAFPGATAGAGGKFSTEEQPVQSFQWADYAAEPGRKYTYTVTARYRSAGGGLETRMSVEVPVTTEEEWGKPHSAFFNRGSVATQEYAHTFHDVPPDKAGQAAYDWLSRGLLEALVKFIGSARAGDQIHGAIYEFQWPAALAALRAASQRGVEVSVLFDDIEAYSKGKPSGPFQANEDAIAKAEIKELCQGRRNGKLMHDKFFVLSRNGEPVSVWTGSTNLTENGIFGHSNLGHMVEDGQVARAFLEYWGRLKADPKVAAPYRKANVAASPLPDETWTEGTKAFFSPRGTDLDTLAWFAELAAEGPLFMTFAFGMNEKFRTVYRKEDDVLRMALLEKEGNPATLAADRKALLEIRKRPNVVMAVGNRIPTNSFDRWLAELDKILPDVNVYWIHTKYMLVDPLGANPTLVTGSANFSDSSTDVNDENMLAIRGDRRIADIYLGEFMRLYAHYAFRESVRRHVEEKEQDAGTWKPQDLRDDDGWTAPYFDPKDGSGRYLRRRFFAGPMAG